MSKIDFSVSRRDLLAGASAAGALAISSVDRAFAKAPLLNAPAPYFYRFKLGSAEATIVSDGTLPLGDPHTNFTGLSKEEMDRQRRLRPGRRSRPGSLGERDLAALDRQHRVGEGGEQLRVRFGDQERDAAILRAQTAQRLGVALREHRREALERLVEDDELHAEH